MNDLFSGPVLVGLLAAGLRLASPLLLSATGELWSQRSGVLNVGLEGYLLLGALAGFLGAYYGGDRVIMGLASSAGAGLIAGLFMGWMMVWWGVDQVVAGIAFNMGALGLTSFLYRRLLAGSFLPPQVTGFRPLLWDLDLSVPLALLGVPVSWFLLKRTHWGLAVRAAGEHPEAVAAAGIPVRPVRLACCSLAGTLSGVAGGCMALSLKLFTENMTAGRGFIVLAAVVFSGWDPWRVLAGCLLFGLADGLQLRLQALSVPVPKQVLMMLPYALCILVLALRFRRTRAPSHLAVPYKPG